MSTPTVQYCRAKDPKECPYHGVVLKMQEAKANLQFDAFADAREELRHNLATKEFAREEQTRDETAQQAMGISFENIARDQEALDAQVALEGNTPVTRPRRTASGAVNTNTLEVPARHTYPEPQQRILPGNSYGSWSGDKYDAYMAPSAIVTNIKRDFAAAQKAGYLPKGLSISAQKDQYSGGYGINVEISGVKDKDRYTYEIDGSVRDENAASKLVRKRIQGIVDAYNFYHRATPFDDSPSYNFGGSINVLNDFMQAAATAEKEAAAAARRAKKVAVELKTEFAAAGAQALQRHGFKVTGATRDGKPVGRIPGTRFIGVIQSGTDGQDHYQMYNLHNFTERSANAFEQQFAHMNAGAIRRKFKRQKFIG